MTEIALTPSLRRVKTAAILSYVGLIFYFLYFSYFALNRQWVLAVPVIWLLYSLPLLGFGHALMHNRIKAYAWLSFLILMYFIHGVLVAFTPGTLWLGLVEVTLCTSTFCFLILFIRQFRSHSGASLFS